MQIAKPLQQVSLDWVDDDGIPDDIWEDIADAYSLVIQARRKLIELEKLTEAVK
jgi:hypothetical protein